MSLVVDHVIPLSKGGGSSIENLVASCPWCNLRKGAHIAFTDPESGAVANLFHPIKQEWHDHFEWNSNVELLMGLTAQGRATIAALALNDPPQVTLRRMLKRARRTN